MTIAAIDRLVHHAFILEMNAESFRRRMATDNQKAYENAEKIKLTHSEQEGKADTGTTR